MKRAWPVVIKPTAAGWHGSAYLCANSLYIPNRKEISNVIESFGHGNSTKPLKRAEEISTHYRINILGSTFLTLIELSGASIQGDFHAQINEKSKDVIGVLYPDLRRDVSDSAPSMVMANNIGRFAVFKASIPGIDVTALQRFLAAMKVRYRQKISQSLTTKRTPMRDHLIHVPENDEEAEEHIDALRACSVGLL